MELILWRHAEAEDDAPTDLLRPLTPRGKKQAADVARWLREQLGPSLETWRIVSSPALRARETAMALGRETDIIDSIAPDASPAAVLAAAGWPDSDHNVILTGHQPTLGMAIARLLHGDAGAVSVKKGALWWFEVRERDGRRESRLKAMVTPDTL